MNLIAATQRPTQKAMGQGALRSQMDVRICFRVRERKDVDLILGQGMLAAGWHAHTLNAPGKFLISAPEHDTPRRARAYLLTDEAVARAPPPGTPTPGPPWMRYPGARSSRRAQTRPDAAGTRCTSTTSRRQRERPSTTPGTRQQDDELWAALSLAPAEGVTVPELMARDRHEPPLGVPAPARPRPQPVRSSRSAAAAGVPTADEPP